MAQRKKSKRRGVTARESLLLTELAESLTMKRKDQLIRLIDDIETELDERTGKAFMTVAARTAVELGFATIVVALTRGGLTSHDPEVLAAKLLDRLADEE